MTGLDSRLKKLKAVLLSATEGVKEVSIRSEPVDYLYGGIIYQHLVAVRTVPGLSKYRKRIIVDCFQKQLKSFPIGRTRLRINDKQVLSLSYD